MGLFLGIFGCIAAIVSIATFVASEMSERRRRQAAAQRISRAVAETTAEKKKAKKVAILEEKVETKGFEWDKLPGFSFLAAQIKIAGMTWQPAPTAAAMAGLAIVGGLVGSTLPILIYPAASSIGLAFALGSAPYMLISRARNKRLTAFESQFPDALDFFARAVRAGHAFSISLELMANEAPEPARTEFRRVFTEHQLGASLESAMKGLTERVPIVDTRFFVSAVLLQRETGGNLSEMLENLSEVIRERFQLKGKVKAASAHGRMTAGALTVIPIALVGLLALTRPGYLTPMTHDHHGRMMLLGAMLGQISGYIVMKKIVNIKV